jgi:ADP-heptose:LPS heptosyltransferase
MRALHQTYPGKFETDVRTSYPAILKFNPFLTKLKLSDAKIIQPTRHMLCTKDIRLPIPLIYSYTKGLGRELGIELEQTHNQPNLYLSTDEEKWEPPIPQPFWLVNACTNPTSATKYWNGYQAVINHFKNKATFIQIGRGEYQHHKLAGAVDMIGNMTLRELIIWVSKCQGAIGPTGLLQHLCAAFDKPYFCIVGGVVSASLIQYPQQQTFHTIGQLPCCHKAGCLRKRLVAPPEPGLGQIPCSYPLRKQGMEIATCMDLIKPTEVILAIQRFLTASNDLTLP